MATEQRTPIKIEGLALGDEGQLHHFNALATREEAAAAAQDLEVGDAAFIKRSDLKWTYAVLAEKDNTDSEGIILRFEVDVEKNRKSFPEKQWGKYIRIIKQEEKVVDVPAPEPAAEEVTEVKEEESKPAEAEAEVKAEAEAEVEAEVKADDSTKTSPSTDSVEVVEKSDATPAPSSPSSTGWFAGFFGSPAAPKQQSTETTSNSLKESVEVTHDDATKPEPEEAAVMEEASVEVEAPVKVEEPVEPVVDEEEDKENDAPAPEEKKRSIFQKLSFSRSSSFNKQKKASIEAPAKAGKSKSKKEWFDPNASEVDYDKNPTDLFQALEARQWVYALTMVEKDNEHFKKDCSTWVVAKGKKKGAALRFRALPLHAAVVFGAPENLTNAILEAYPLAARGRDVKGRLPIHLACEHDVSDEVLLSLIKSFPKAFYAKDKLEKTPLDYMNDNGNRKWIKQMIPSLVSTKVEDEKTKWDKEKEEALLKYREALKSDPDYNKDVFEAVEEKTETKYANKFELVELSHKKEIELLKMKHAEETRALLEGFEVKLNFERKLQSIKAKEAAV